MRKNDAKMKRNSKIAKTDVNNWFSGLRGVFMSLLNEILDMRKCKQCMKPISVRMYMSMYPFVLLSLQVQSIHWLMQLSIYLTICLSIFLSTYISMSITSYPSCPTKRRTLCLFVLSCYFDCCHIKPDTTRTDSRTLQNVLLLIATAALVARGALPFRFVRTVVRYTRTQLREGARRKWGRLFLVLQKQLYLNDVNIRTHFIRCKVNKVA